MNGFLTALITVEYGVQQICLLSLIPFICMIEPLAQQLRQDLRISRVQIPGGGKAEMKVLAYMDKLNVPCSDKWSVERMLQHTQVYRLAAGAKLNMGNTTCLVLGKLGGICWPWASPVPTRR